MPTLISSAPEAIQSVTSATAPEAKQATVVARSRAARTHTIVARVLLGGVALQIFFAGLGVFNVSSFVPHMILGTLVILGSLALPLIAWRGRLDAALTHRSWLLFALMILQGLLIDVGRLIPLVAAFHPLNAMLLVLLTASMARLTSAR
jgi:hypothetical protein